MIDSRIMTGACHVLCRSCFAYWAVVAMGKVHCELNLFTQMVSSFEYKNIWRHFYSTVFSEGPVKRGRLEGRFSAYTQTRIHTHRQKYTDSLNIRIMTWKINSVGWDIVMRKARSLEGCVFGFRKSTFFSYPVMNNGYVSVLGAITTTRFHEYFHVNFSPICYIIR